MPLSAGAKLGLSVSWGAQEPQLRVPDKRPEVPVARKQERAVIQAGLHNERIRQFWLVPQSDHAGAQDSRTDPIVFRQFKPRNLLEKRRGFKGKRGIAQ